MKLRSTRPAKYLVAFQLAAIVATSVLIVGLTSRRVAAEQTTYCRNIGMTSTATVPPGQGLEMSYVLQSDCTLKQVSSAVVLTPTGVRSRRASGAAVAESISTLTGVGLVYQWLRDVAGLPLNEPELNATWRWDGTINYEGYVVGLADYARDGWVPTVNTAAWSSFTSSSGTAVQHAEYIFAGGFHNTFDNTATVLPNGGMSCTWAYHFDQGTPGWEFKQMCFSSVPGTFLGGL